MTTVELAPVEEEAPPVPTEEELQAQAWASLNPCQLCGAQQHDAPEKDARVALHCWRCGFRPGQAVAAHLVRPQQLDVAGLVAELRKGVVEDVMAALKAGQTPTVTFTPTGGSPEVI